MHGNDEIGTTLIAGLLESKGFPIERLNPDASLSAGAFQNDRDDFAARFANGEYVEFGISGGVANATEETVTAPENSEPIGNGAERYIEAGRHYIEGGVFTEAEVERLYPLNRAMSPDEFVRELAMLKQGFGTGRLVTSAPAAPAPASSSAMRGEAVNLGQRPDLIGEANALLDRTIAEGNQPGASDRSLDSAEVAQQISRRLAEDPNRVIAVLDDNGAITGVGAYSISRNVFNPAENDILYAEALLRLGPPGSGVALTLLQSMFDQAPRGIMRLRSLNPELDDYYEGLGGRPVTTPGASQHLFEWLRPPAKQP